MSRESNVLAENPSTDLAVLDEMVSELEEYIVKEELYRTIIVHAPGGEVRVQMTGGDLLTRLLRLEGERQRLTPEQQRRLDELKAQAETTIYSLKTRFNTRLLREAKARLDSMKWFLDEVGEDRQRARANYPYEIRNRQRVEEIVKRFGADLPTEVREQLQSVDHRLRLLTQGSTFIWDPLLQGIFTQSPYWYLYASIA